MCSRIGPNDKFGPSETESEIPNQSCIVGNGPADQSNLHETTIPIRQESNSPPYQHQGYYQQYYDIELNELGEGNAAA